MKSAFYIYAFLHGLIHRHLLSLKVLNVVFMVIVVMSIIYYL
jgi:uncharacterized membrane protein